MAQTSLKATNDNVSYKLELKNAIDRGIRFLASQQNSNGWWSTPDHPAVSALVLTAMMGDPSHKYVPSDEIAAKGFAFLLKEQKTNGGIYVKDLPNYNTAVSVMALITARNTQFLEPIQKARSFLVGMQQKGTNVSDKLFEGGIGYGSRYNHSDLNNTLMALEALYYSRILRGKQNENEDFNWTAALNFVKNCQNWEGAESGDKGGFIYYPGHSMAGGTTNNGKISLRSYGSASYAGLLSFIYASADRNSERVKGVAEWLDKNYSVEENPGMGQQGYFYYLHLAAKALALTENKTVPGERSASKNWKKDISMRLLNLQRADGSWFNENNRWWEKDPILTSSYALMTLDLIYHRL